MRHYKGTMYVDAGGRLIRAGDTDQAGLGSGIEARTYRGLPVELCGDSFTMERKYERTAILRARKRAALRQLALVEAKIRGYHARLPVGRGEISSTLHQLREAIGGLAACASLLEQTDAGIVADWYSENGEQEIADQIRHLSLRVIH